MGARGNGPGSPRFRPYRAADRLRCLALFDANCPAYFAPNERDEYDAFLQGLARGYTVCVVDGRIAGAFGVIERGGGALRLHWIMVDPEVHGRGLGRAIMERVVEQAAALRTDGERRPGPTHVDIAASQHSASFFARFGARAVRIVEDGWGPGMHRVDMELPM